MSRKAFGEFVRVLRTKRTFLDEHDSYRAWTQKELARRCNLTARQISSIEQGRTVDLTPFLAPLAAAFGLNDIEKATFYAKAGFHYPVIVQQRSKDFIHTLLQQIHYPASIRTPVWDFVAFNAYHRVLWGYDAQTLLSLDDGDLGPNLLRVLFDSQFGGQTTYQSKRWQEEVVIGFRSSSFGYINTKRYRQIFRHMQKNRDFQRVWNLIENAPDDWHPEQRPFLKVVHPHYGPMEFISFRIPERYLGRDVDLSVYVPVVPSEEPYRQLRNSVTDNLVYFFREEPLE